MVAAAILFRYAFVPLAEKGLQFVTVFPLVIIVAIIAGRWPAVLYSVIASPIAAYLFSRRFDLGVLASTVLVVLTAFVAGWLSERLHAALDKSQRDADALARSEQRFRVAQELSPDGFTILRPVRDEHGRIIDFTWVYENATIARLNGTEPEAVVGRRLLDIIPSHVKSPIYNLYIGVAESGKPDGLEAPFHGETMEKEKWFHIAVVPIDGDIAIYAQDITERKKTEEALLTSESFYRQMIESIPGMVFTTRPDGYCDYQSRQWVEYTGVPMEQMVGDGWNKLLHPDDQPRAFAAWRGAVEEHAPYDLEYRVRRYDGQYEWFKVRGTPIRDENGKIVRWFGVATNINDLKKAEDALRQSEKHFRDLADSMPQIVWTARPDGYVDYFNRRWYEVTKSDPGMMGDESWVPALHPDDVQRVKQLVAESVNTGKIFYTELRLIVFEKNEYRWHIARALPVKDDQGTIIRWYGTATDIHELKQAHDTLDLLKTDLENKNRELASIISIVSHDLRAPLVNIQGFSHELQMDYKAVDTLLAKVPVERKVQMQLDQLLCQNIPEYLQYIETSSEAMNNLLRSLTETARAGLTPVKPEVIDMEALLYKTLESIKIKFKKAYVTYDVTTLPDCFADRMQTAQIFTNLLDNAVKYLDPSRPGWICIEGTPQADGILYSVSDNGIGIPTEYIDRIFEPYYQLKEKAAGGIGMGLATVKKLVDRNNGKIWVISEKGKYSTFYVALPAPPSQ